MTERLEVIANDLLSTVQGGRVWDQEGKLENMIIILEERARAAKSTQEKKLAIFLLLILKTLDHYDFDPYESELTYILPGVVKYSFKFYGFYYESVLNFITGEQDKVKKVEKRGLKKCSYRFVHLDDMQENLAELVAKFERKKEWRQIKNSLYEATTA